MIQDILEGVKDIKDLANKNKSFMDMGDYKSVSDGYHTIGDLYEHRTYLFAMICKLYIPTVYVWKTRKHEDGTMYDDMFLVGIDLPNGQISYHRIALTRRFSRERGHISRYTMETALCIFQELGLLTQTPAGEWQLVPPVGKLELMDAPTYRRYMERKGDV